MEFGVDDSAVGGLDILAAREEDCLPLSFSDRNFALFKATEAEFV